MKIKSADQLTALRSAVSIEIIQAIRSNGPSTTAEVALLLGRKSNSLHYHIKNLKKVGFLTQVDTRQSGARQQAVYDVVANTYSYQNASKNPKLRKCVNDIVTAMLRLAGRNFAKASEQPSNIRDEGAQCNMLADRYKARLKPTQLAQVNKHLHAIHDIFSKGQSNRHGELCAITIVMTPEHDATE